MGPRASMQGCGKSCAATGIDPQSVHPAASRYSKLATPAEYVYAVLLREVETFLLVNDESTYQARYIEGDW
jgi:hypothetical protein